MSGLKPLDCHAQKGKKKPIGSYYNADFYFEVTQNSIPSEHYSFRAKYTAEPPGISIELTIVTKYHHSGRLSNPFSHQFHLQTVYCAFQDPDYGSQDLSSPCCSVIQSRKQI